MIRCAQCPGVYNCVPPSGPTEVEVIFAGEAPGKAENQSRVPFVGKTGREVDEHYLPLAGLRRDNCYFTNTIKCLPNTPKNKLDMNKPATKALIESCATQHLYDEISDINPRVIVPMGAVACWAIDPAISLDLHHGLPFKTRLGITAFPMWHPAGGMHSPKTMLQIRTDWWRFRQYLRGKLVIIKDRYPNPDYKECNGYSDIDEIDPTLPMACDTESSRSKGPYFLTYSQEPGVSRLIRASRIDLIQQFQTKLDKWESEIIFHNWMYDKKVTTEMWLKFPDKRMRDTMIMAYHLGNLPQGLKALAFRELGVKMMDFEDLVKPYSQPKVLDYYREAQQLDWVKPDEQLKRDEKTGFWKIYKPQSMSTKFKRFWTDYGKNPDKDPFTMWTDNWVESQALIEQKMGKPWPGMDIAHVEQEKAFAYAMRDADVTLRLYGILLKMRRNVRKQPQEKWRD